MKVIFSYGLGWDSTAILLRWLEEPSTRDFDLSDLVVITAMTGDEFADTKRLVERHVLPRLTMHGIRYVQVARNGPAVADGFSVLSDTRFPATLHTEGVWKLSDELTRAGTVPQVASGQRRCSQKFKGVPLDWWIERETAGAHYRHVMGFNADEMKRVEKDRGYSTVERMTEYPLVTWGWGRARLEAYVESIVGERWAKSCCEFCPFARDNHLDRYREDPRAGQRAMDMEFASLCLNPRSTLFASKSIIRLVKDADPVLYSRWVSRLAEGPWQLYEVKRILPQGSKGPTHMGRAQRSVKTVGEPIEGLIGHIRLERALREIGERLDGLRPVCDEHGIVRLWIRERGPTYPTAEHMMVVGPAGIHDKERTNFDTRWREVA